jgi:hypothetical protein
MYSFSPGKDNNMEKKLKQRRSGKLLGGVTGKGFLPGKTGNPNGRPRTRGLVNALRASVSDISPDGRSIEELLVAALIEEAFGGRNGMAALAYIFDRLEGRPSQQIEVADITRELREKTDEELRFYLEHNRWPTDNDSLSTENDTTL